MKRIALSIALWLGLAALAQAQCIAVGGVNTVPQTGVSCLSEPNIDSFSASGVGIVPAATATDVACITGSATRVVRLQSIRVSGTGTAITIPLVIVKRASADTGGTPATALALPVPYALDSVDAAATATTIAYTANPTVVDSAPGLIDVAQIALAATTTSTSAGFTLFDYTHRHFVEAPTLRGIAQQICVNLNGTSPTASLNISFRWTEQPQ